MHRAPAGLEEVGSSSKGKRFDWRQAAVKRVHVLERPLVQALQLGSGTLQATLAMGKLGSELVQLLLEQARGSALVLMAGMRCQHVRPIGNERTALYRGPTAGPMRRGAGCSIIPLQGVVVEPSGADAVSARNLSSDEVDIPFSFIVWPEEGAPGQILEGDDWDSLLVQALSLVKPGGLIAERQPGQIVRIFPDPWSPSPIPR
jgi:hypothetical protein